MVRKCYSTWGQGFGSTGAQLQPVDIKKSTKVGFTKGHNVPVATGNDASLERGLLITQDEACNDRLVIKRDANSIEGYLGVALDWASEEQVALQVTWSQVDVNWIKWDLSKPRLLKESLISSSCRNTIRGHQVQSRWIRELDWTIWHKLLKFTKGFDVDKNRLLAPCAAYIW